MKILGHALISVGVLGVIASIFLYLHQPRQPRQTSHPTSVAVNKLPSSAPISTSSVAQYSVPAHDPKYIEVPSIGITKARIIKLGLLGDGSMATPNNVYDTGWYDGSSRPGQAGAMFIFGHVSSWTAIGVFHDLKKLVPGNIITITRGDDKTYTYKVVALKVYPYNKVDMAQVLSPTDTKIPGLNLMTCTGSIIKGTSEFNDRLVVYTSLITP